MKGLITFLEKNVKSAVYTGVNIHGLYNYLEMIEAPTTFTTSVKISCHFSPSCSTKNYASTLRPVIAALGVW